MALKLLPAYMLDTGMEKLAAELEGIAKERGIKLAADEIDDVLTCALFPQIGLEFL